MSIHHLIFILRIRRVHITYILRSSARTNEPRQIVRKVFGAEFVHRDATLSNSRMSLLSVSKLSHSGAWRFNIST